MNSLLSDHSKPGTVAGAQLVHSEPLCQSGKGSLSSRHFTSSCRKTVIINIQIGHICDVNSTPPPHRRCPCAALTRQSGLGGDVMDRPPAAQPLVLCPREQCVGPLGASGKVVPLVEQTEGPGRGRCRAEVEVNQEEVEGEVGGGSGRPGHHLCPPPEQTSPPTIPRGHLAAGRSGHTCPEESTSSKISYV